MTCSPRTSRWLRRKQAGGGRGVRDKPESAEAGLEGLRGLWAKQQNTLLWGRPSSVSSHILCTPILQTSTTGCGDHLGLHQALWGPSFQQLPVLSRPLAPGHTSAPSGTQ